MSAPRGEGGFDAAAARSLLSGLRFGAARGVRQGPVLELVRQQEAHGRVEILVLEREYLRVARAGELWLSESGEAFVAVDATCHRGATRNVHPSGAR